MYVLVHIYLFDWKKDNAQKLSKNVKQHEGKAPSYYDF